VPTVQDPTSRNRARGTCVRTGQGRDVDRRGPCTLHAPLLTSGLPQAIWCRREHASRRSAHLAKPSNLRARPGFTPARTRYGLAQPEGPFPDRAVRQPHCARSIGSTCDAV
jgi:hypothetical protein